MHACSSGVYISSNCPSGPKTPSCRPTAIWSSVMTTSNGDVVAGAAADEALGSPSSEQAPAARPEHEKVQGNPNQPTHDGGGYRAWQFGLGHGLGVERHGHGG